MARMPIPLPHRPEQGRIVEKLGCLNPGSIIGVAGVLLLFGSIFFGPLFLFAIIAAVLLLCMGVAVERMCARFLCSQCGNRVERESRMCPCCRAELLPPRRCYAVIIMLIFILITVTLVGLKSFYTVR